MRIACVSFLNRQVLLIEQSILLNSTRKSSLASIILGGRPSLRAAIYFKVAKYSLLGLLLYILPWYIVGELLPFEAVGQNLMKYQGLLVNGSCVALFYCGLYIGMNLVFYLTMTENESLLAYPITLRALARHRILYALSFAVKFCFFVLLPCLLVPFAQQGLTLISFIMVLVICQLLFFVSYLFGVDLLLIILRRKPSLRPEWLFISIFLASSWAIVILIKANRHGAFALLPSGYLAGFRALIDRVSPAALVESLANTGAGAAAPVFLLLVGGIGCAILLLVNMLEGMLTEAYGGVHVETALDARHSERVGRREARPARGLRIDYFGLSRALSFLPVEIRAWITKDLLFFLRKPHFIWKMLIFVVAVWVVVHLRSDIVAYPAVGAAHFLSSYVVFNLFINAIGFEKSNIFLIKRLFASPFRYLAIRARIAFLVSLVVVVPLWAGIGLLEHSEGWIDIAKRSGLLFLNLTMSTLIVTGYGAAFAVFREEKLGENALGISSGAMFGYWCIGGLVPFFFYRLDRRLMFHAESGQHDWLIVLAGCLIVGSIILFGFLGERRIRRYE